MLLTIKLSLAVSQAGDGVPYVKKFKDILRKLYDFFDNSSVKTAGLGAVQELLNDPKLKLPATTIVNKVAEFWRCCETP